MHIELTTPTPGTTRRTIHRLLVSRVPFEVVPEVELGAWTVRVAPEHASALSEGTEKEE